QIIIVRKGKIISSVLQKITLSGVISKGRNQKTRGTLVSNRKKSKRKSNWSGDIHNYHISKTYYHFFSRNQFKFSGMKIIFRIIYVFRSRKKRIFHIINRVVFSFTDSSFYI